MHSHSSLYVGCALWQEVASHLCVWVPTRSCGLATRKNLLALQVRAALLLTCQFLTLALEEDGSVIDTEHFFQSLPDDAEIMVLEKGQTWSHIKVTHFPECLYVLWHGFCSMHVGVRLPFIWTALLIIILHRICL